jgi:hypothetical protein
MGLKPLRVIFMEKDTGKELVTITAPSTEQNYKEGTLTVKELYRIEQAGKRYIRERIGYSGAVKVRVKA